MQSLGILILFALVVVYIVLGILHESFIHPLTILSGLPSASFGALLMAQIFNVPLSLYAFVGVIMLIGIVKKNAIMMIDFALARQPLGLAVVGGLLVSQLLTLYLTPVIYVYLDRLSRWRPTRRDRAIAVPAE